MAAKKAVNSIKHLLSDRKVSIAVFSLAISARVIQVLYFFNLRSDRTFQLLATDNFLDGQGISTAHVFAPDLSATVYEPLIKWPPGYSLLIAPFYLLAGRNYIAAALTVDILFAIAFVVLCRAIVKHLDLPLYLVNLLTLFAGFFIYGFYFISSTDAIAITLFLGALYSTVLLLKRNDRWWCYASWGGAALLGCVLIKYLFIPAVFVVPGFLIAKGLIDKQAGIKKAGLVSLSILLVGLGALFLYQSSVSREAEYVGNLSSGFFPENLLAAYPFLPASFIKPDTILKLLNWGQEGSIVRIFQWLHLLLLFVTLAGVVRMMLRQGVRKVPLTESFFYLCFFVSLAVVGLLALLSLQYGKAEEMPGLLWTFIQEPRYYGLPNILIHLSVFVLYHYSKIRSSGALKFTAALLLLLLSAEWLRGGLFVVNRAINLGREEYSWQYEDQFQKYAAGVIAQAQKEHAVGKVAVTSPSYYYRNRVALYCQIPTMDEVHKINRLSALRAKDPVLLLVMLHQKDLMDFQPFITQQGGKAAGNFDGYSFYTVYVTPH